MTAKLFFRRLGLLALAGLCIDAAGAPLRPYEFEWAGRTRDEFPPVLRLERADGWRVVASNAVATVSTSADLALFGESVMRLDYCASGEKPVIRLEPPSPVPIDGAFDTLTLWVYGNNIRGKPCPSVRVSAEFTTLSGETVRRSLGAAAHKEWFLQTNVAKPLPGGCRFTGFTFSGAMQKEMRTVYLTSFCAFTDPRRPLPKRTIPEIKVFPDGENAVVPPPVKLERKLEFRFPKDGSDWSDLAFRYGEGEWIALAAGGGLFPRSAAKEAKVSFRTLGNSLVCEIECAAPGIEEVRFGGVADDGAKLTGWPYYTYVCFNQWDNPVLKNKGCAMEPCFYRPKILSLKVGGRTLFVGATFDWTVSLASGPICLNVAPKGTRQLNGGLFYLPKTDGTLNPCRERLVWTFSEDVADVFPAIPNPKSPYMAEAGSRSWTAFHAGTNRLADIAYWRAVKKAGMDRIVVNDHESGWRDGNESFTFRMRTAPKKGGDRGQYEYARVMIDELGYLYGPYNNFTDYAPVNGFWSLDNAARRSDGNLIHAWNRCYSPKADWAVGMCALLAPEIQRKFNFNTAYCDVHTCVTPWNRVDYDARSPDAGKFSSVLGAYAEIMLLQKKAWKGPVYSEGGIHWLYAGFADGSYAQDPQYDFENSPWLVDFDLKRLHELSCNFGMGAPYMFYGEENARLKKKDPQEWIDRFTAATLAFGHPGFFISARKPDNLEQEKESYYPVQAIAECYTTAQAVEIFYAAADGTLHPTSRALVNGAAMRSQIKVVYSDGTTVAVNGNRKENFKVEVGGVVYDLPPNGWRAQSSDAAVVSFNGIENGVRVKYAKSPEYEWRKTLPSP